MSNNRQTLHFTRAFTKICGLGLLAALGCLSIGGADDKAKLPTESDTLLVSKMGKDAESKQKALEIFELCKAEHDKEFAANKDELLKDAVRFTVIRRLEGTIYLVSHKKKATALHVEDAQYKPGQTTEPYELKPHGTYKYRALPTDAKALGLAAATPPKTKKETPKEKKSFFGIDFDGKETKKADPPKDSKTPLKPIPRVLGLTPKVLADAELTRKKFLAKLKEGKTYNVTQDEERKCKNCLGFGQVDDSSTPSGKATCQTCEGSGVRNLTVNYTVQWK